MRRALVIFGAILACSLMRASPSKAGKTETIVLGGGCFWCVEAAYKLLPGVKYVVSGYSGGHVRNPSYKEVCTGETGHAEVVKIEFDPTKISLEDILVFFWEAHDPTTLNRQGADVGTQYRSVIFYANEAQKAVAEKSRTEAQKDFSSPIVTVIEPLGDFWTAEDYHQDYFAQNPEQGYCRLVIGPKIDKLKKHLKK
jgi:peptide-methionine (S)-S-oxide reductase